MKPCHTGTHLWLLLDQSVFDACHKSVFVSLGKHFGVVRVGFCRLDVLYDVHKQCQSICVGLLCHRVNWYFLVFVIMNGRVEHANCWCYESSRFEIH